MLELIGKKIGMTHIFDKDGITIPLTFMQVYDNYILNHLNHENKNLDNVVIAFERCKNARKISKPFAGIFNKKSIPIFKKIHSSQIKKGSDLKVGNSIAVDSVFKEGDKISIRGVTIGKGFAGVMKRWNFAGLEASHGVSISHRSHGSTGQRQDPGKTFRGKKMAGHMGVSNVTVKNLEIVLVDKEKSVIAVRGSVPGNKGSDVILKITKGF